MKFLYYNSISSVSSVSSVFSFSDIKDNQRITLLRTLDNGGLSSVEKKSH